MQVNSLPWAPETYPRVGLPVSGQDRVETLVLAGPWTLVPALGSSPGITMALAGPWGSPFIALNPTLLICLVGKIQLCLRRGLGELEAGGKCAQG